MEQLSILVVDDDARLAEAIALVLRGVGFDPTVSTGFEAASSRLRERRFDYCLSDVKLTDGSGQNLAALCHKYDVPCVLISGSDDEVQRLSALGYTVLLKPVLEEQLRLVFAAAS